MHGRVYDLSRIVRNPRRYVVISLLALIGSLFVHGSGAGAKSGYEIINTGIKGGGCWYDDSHFIVVKGQQPAPGQEFEVEGLYYLDPRYPKDLKRIDLSPIDPSLQRRIRDVTCQEETILFDVMASDQKTTTLYGIKIGQQPELVADLRWAKPAGISLKGRYALGNKLTVDKGVWTERADCDVRAMKPGLKALCWPRDTIGQWVTPQFVIHEYLWRETVLVMDQHGNRERIPNPKPPLKLAEGRELKQGYLLRDLENRILKEIPTRQGPYKIDAISFKPNPGGTYLYARCSKVGDYDPPKTFFGRICRLKLAGVNEEWKEVFSTQKAPNEPASLYAFDLNDAGDVVAVRRANRTSPTLWKYTPHPPIVAQLPVASLNQEVEAVQLAPDGQTISFVDHAQLIFIRSREVKP